MADRGVDRRGAVLDQHLGGVHSVPAEIVKSSTISAVRPADRADELDDLGRLGVIDPPLVRDRGRRMQPVGPLPGFFA